MKNTIFGILVSLALSLSGVHAQTGCVPLGPCSGGAGGGFPVGQQPGIATNTPASAGNVGEIAGPQQRLEASSISLTTATPVDVTSTGLSLTPGDWMIYGQCNLDTAGSTLVQGYQCGISTTLNTRPSPDQIGGFSALGAGTGSALGGGLFPLTPLHVLISTTTTYHLVMMVNFTTNTANAYGSFYAVRIR